MKYKPVKSIRKIKKKVRVYNFDVPDYETYIANGMVVHNCQNHKVSQNLNGNSTFYSPSELVDLAIKRGVAGIAFTYNEPTVYHGYIEEVGHCIGRSSKTSHLKLVIKTNGFVRPWVIRDLCLYADAINIDLKGDNDDYKEVCGGWLEPVVECVEWVLRMGVHLEISYLVLPSKIDNDLFNVQFRNWLSDLNPNVPVHLLYFYPFHKMVVPSYKPSRLLELRELMRRKLRHVYISNHFGSDSSMARNTYCDQCGSEMIVRNRELSVQSLECCNVKLYGTYY